MLSKIPFTIFCLSIELLCILIVSSVYPLWITLSWTNGYKSSHGHVFMSLRFVLEHSEDMVSVFWTFSETFKLFSIVAVLFCISTYNFWEIQFLCELSSVGIDHVSLWASLAAQTVKSLPAMQIDLGSIPALERFPGEGNGYPLQYSCLENPHGQRNLAGFSIWGCKESDMTEWLSIYYYSHFMCVR